MIPYSNLLLKTAKLNITSQVSKLKYLTISCHLGLSLTLCLCVSFSRLSSDDNVETENTVELMEFELHIRITSFRIIGS